MTRALLPIAVLLGLPGCKGQVSGHAAEMGTFTCKGVDKEVCVGPTDRFEATAPIVHILYKTKDVPRNGDVFTFDWIAEDVGAAAPPNTVITTANKEVTEVVPGGTYYVLEGHLTKPTKGWPVGKYRVDVKLGGKQVTSARFSIQ